MELTIRNITGRNVDVSVTWDNEGDPILANFTVPNVRVESFAEAVEDMTKYVTAMYEGERNKRLAYLAANPTPDPQVLAAVGHTFDDQGNVLS